MIGFKIRDIKGYNLDQLVFCRNCENNKITQRVNYVNVCDREDCKEAAMSDAFRYPDPPVTFKELR